MRVVEVGIVTEIVNRYSVKISLPEIDRSIESLNYEVGVTVTAIQPGIYPEYKVGDVVIVGFRSRGYSEPVILGLMDCEKTRKTKSNASLSEITVTGKTTLSSETSIGEVKKNNIKHLKGLKTNVDSKFTALDAEDKALNGRIDTEAKTRSDEDARLEGIQSTMQVQVNEIDETVDSHLDNEEIHLTSDEKIKLSNNLYCSGNTLKHNNTLRIISGTELPASTDGYNEGDIYILLQE